MAKPRRAARRRVNGRVLISSSLIGVTAIATFAVWQMSDTEASVALPAAEESAVIETASTPSPSPDPTSSPSTRPTSAATSAATSASANANAKAASASAIDWAAVVDGCKATVRSRDAVIARAGTGIDHWSQHVQAQTDANAGRISVDAMKKSFMRTRLLGPGDIARYRDALDTAAQKSDGCSAPKGAPADVAATLRPCGKRLSAQKPVLTAGARGMGDWSSHLAAMRRNKETHVHNAQQVWVDAWRAAPPHIKAFDKAAASYRAAAAC